MVLAQEGRRGNGRDVDSSGLDLTSSSPPPSTTMLLPNSFLVFFFLASHAMGSINDDDDISIPEIDEPSTSSGQLSFASPMKNYTKLKTGDSLKLRCEVRGSPPANHFRWFLNEVALEMPKGRIKAKESLGGPTQWSRIKFRELDVHDTGFYRCEATNGRTMVSGESFVKVHLAEKWEQQQRHDSFDYSDYDDYDYHDVVGGNHGLIPESFPLDFNPDLSGGVDGLPSHLLSSSPARGRTSSSAAAASMASATSNGGLDLPSLKPDERGVGSCQRYTGSICAAYVSSGDAGVFVSRGLTQEYIEKRLQASLQVITTSPELSGECAKYAVPAICLSTLPLCDRQTRKPRKVSEARKNPRLMNFPHLLRAVPSEVQWGKKPLMPVKIPLKMCPCRLLLLCCRD